MFIKECNYIHDHTLINFYFVPVPYLLYDNLKILKYIFDNSSWNFMFYALFSYE